MKKYEDEMRKVVKRREKDGGGRREGWGEKSWRREKMKSGEG